MRYLLYICMIVLLLPFFVKAADQESEGEEYSDVPKAIHLDLNYGFDGFGAGIGLRYWQVGFSMGITGFANYIPSYIYQYPQGVKISRYEPLPAGFESEKYTKVMVTGDLTFYLPFFGSFQGLASIGYYSQADTLLAKDLSTGWHYFYYTQNSSGLTYGLGFEYSFQNDLAVGILAHTKRGLVAKFIYNWY